MKSSPYFIVATHAIAFILITISGGWFYRHMELTMEQQVHARFIEDGRSRIKDIEMLVEDTSNDLLSYAELPAFKLLRFHQLTLNTSAAREDIRHLELFFLGLQQRQHEIKQIRFIYPDGTEGLKVEEQHIVTSLSDLSQYPEVKSALELKRYSKYISLFGQHKEHRTLTWWIPVYASTTVPLGVLSFDIDMAILENTIQRAAEPGKTELKLSAEGKLILTSSPESSFHHDNSWQITQSLGTYGLNAKVTLVGNKDAYLDNLYSTRRLLLVTILPLLSAFFFFLIWSSIKRIHSEKQIRQLAYYDTLTGLVNRNQFEERLSEALHHSHDSGIEHALLYIDLDQFKIVNDTCGHMAGDQLLEQLAMQLNNKVRKNDTLARLGGDEFALLLEGCNEERARLAAEDIHELISEFRFIWENKSFSVGASIGVAPINKDTPNIDTVLNKADLACYMAKELGRGRIHVHMEDDKDLAQQHGEMQWVTRLKIALDKNSLFLECQPIIPLSADSTEPKRWELLVRINDKGKTIYPDAFMPAAERYGLMPQIDRWVVHEAFTTLSKLPAKDVIFFINISGASLSETDFLDYTKNLLREFNVPPQSICFEVTETAAIRNMAIATSFIEQMSMLGCQMALDDFGTGLCSFNYLKHLPVQYVKIDGTFIKNILEDDMNQTIVSVIKLIGDAASLSTIAELVPDEKVKHLLTTIGIDYAQGFGIAKPQPLSAISKEFDALSTTTDSMTLSTE